jgi:excisionase family DNA binding protein
MEPLLLRAAEIAHLLGIGRTKAYELMASGQLPVVRLGRAVRVPREALTDWVTELSSAAVGPDLDRY